MFLMWWITFEMAQNYQNGQISFSFKRRIKLFFSFFKYFHDQIKTDMKKLFFLSTVAVSVFILSNCGSSKSATSATAPVVAKSTYEANMVTAITDNCSPCHIPAKGGNKKAYDNFANVKSDIDEIIRRINLNPGERGFMPFKKSAKLSDSTIAIFTSWKEDGMLEK